LEIHEKPAKGMTILNGNPPPQDKGPHPWWEGKNPRPPPLEGEEISERKFQIFFVQDFREFEGLSEASPFP